MRTPILASATTNALVYSAIIICGITIINGALTFYESTRLAFDFSEMSELYQSSRALAGNLGSAGNLISLFNLFALTALLVRVLIPAAVGATKALVSSITDGIVPENKVELQPVSDKVNQDLVFTMSRNLQTQQSVEGSVGEQLFIGQDLQLLPPSLRRIAKLDNHASSWYVALLSILVWTVVGFGVSAVTLYLSNLQIEPLVIEVTKLLVVLVPLIVLGTVVLAWSSISNILFSRRILAAADVGFSQSQRAIDGRMRVIASPANIPSHIRSSLLRQPGIGLHLFDARVGKEQRSNATDITGNFFLAPTFESDMRELDHPLRQIAKKRLNVGWMLLVIGSALALAASIIPSIIGISGVSFSSLLSPLGSLTLLVTTAVISRSLMRVGREFVTDADSLGGGLFSTSEFTIANLYGEVVELNGAEPEGVVQQTIREKGCRLSYEVNSAEVTFFQPEGSVTKEIISAKETDNSSAAIDRMLMAIESLAHLDRVPEVEPQNEKYLQGQIIESHEDDIDMSASRKLGEEGDDDPGSSDDADK